MDMMFDLRTLAAAYAGGLSPVEVAREVLRRIAAGRDPAVWISRVPEAEVLARARTLAADATAKTLPLYGVPFAVKDNIDCAGLATTAACPDFAYAPETDAPVVARLLAAGAILMGKTNLDQFATGLVGTRSPHGVPRCVFDVRYVSGGSSSGSAVAVASGQVSFALGTDTAGSGRVPAAYNNIVGMKPTRGLVSMRGVVPACRSLDCASVFALTVEDARRVMDVMQDFDAGDPYARKAREPRHISGALRFGVLPPEACEFFGRADYAALYDAAVTRLAALGGEKVEIDYAPFRTAARLLYDGPWVAERLAAIGPFMTAHEAAMDPSVRTIIAGAKRKSAVDAFEGQYALAACIREAEAQWARMDALLLPTAPTHDTVAEVAADPLGRNARLGLYTNFVNLLDCCAVAIPGGFCTDGLPFGVSLVAPAFADTALADIAGRLHRAAGCGMGIARDTSLPEPEHAPETDRRIALFVVGAHLTGMPLNRELQTLGATFERAVRTAPDYRFYALANTRPPKPGLVRAPGFRGPGIAGEVWRLPPEAFGAFVANIPAPLGIGKIALEDGGTVSGFLCEPYGIAGAEDITALGGWRAYLAEKT